MKRGKGKGELGLREGPRNLRKGKGRVEQKIDEEEASGRLINDRKGRIQV